MDVSNTRSRNTLTKEQALERLLTELDDAVVPSKRTRTIRTILDSVSEFGNHIHETAKTDYP